MRLRLAELPVLALDCQATAASPAKGHLLEVGWSLASAAAGTKAGIDSRLMELPAGATIPERVCRLTGISEEETKQGVTAAEVWRLILEAAADSRTAVIHFSSFEMPYLRQLHRETAPDAPFPFRILCTHRIAKRLVPTLPRHGLRAVAGYFGHGVPELRRAAHHVQATLSVWSSLVARLENELDIGSLEGLLEWLAFAENRPVSGTHLRYPMKDEARRDLPRKPGVYRMLRSNGDVLYVGKATSLRDRVASYFRAGAHHPEHILEMLSQAQGLRTTVSGSALEAALLETEEIKNLAPPYNKALRARDRTLVFLDGTLGSVSSKSGTSFRLGPLPGSRLPEAFVSVQRLLHGDEVPIEKVIGSGEHGLPDEPTFRAGFAQFRERLGTSSLLAHGIVLWVDEPDESEDETDFRLKLQYSDGARRRWTAERVVARLEETIRRVAHLVRRAHWLCLLAESTIAWQTRSEETLAIVLEAGRVAERRRLTAKEPAPEPPGWKRAFPDRRLDFDIERYDRLTVLTRELRRLVCEKRRLAVCLGRGILIDGDRLGQMLRWI